MAFYKDDKDNVYAFDDNVPSRYLPKNLISIGEQEAETLRVARIPVPVPPVPKCTPLQLRKALNQTNRRADVEAYLVTAPQNIKDLWEVSHEFRAGDEFFTALQTALGLTNGQQVALVQLARTL